ncbi:Uncharacterised protein [uncultured archaeon]|nr:Uncharacterised protein [uncultured archaeon]
MNELSKSAANFVPNIKFTLEGEVVTCEFYDCCPERYCNYKHLELVEDRCLIIERALQKKNNPYFWLSKIQN